MADEIRNGKNEVVYKASVEELLDEPVPMPPLNVFIDVVELLRFCDGDDEMFYTIIGNLKDLLL